MNIFIDPLLFLQGLRELTGGIFNSFFVSCSFYGENISVIVLMAMFYWCFDKKLGEYLFISFSACLMVTSFLKNLFCIYRPWVMDSRIKPVEEALPRATGYSFPSGHSANATLFFGGTLIRGNYSKLFKILFILCIALISFSRLFVGVHSVLDVGIAIIAVLIVLVLFNRLFDLLEEKPNLDIIISVVGILISAVLLFYFITKGYPMDYDSAGKLIVDPAVLTLGTFYNFGFVLGFLISWPIERRFIQFSDKGTTEEKITRFLFGFLGIGFISQVLFPLIGTDAPLEIFTGSLIMAFFVMLIYPAIIKFFQNRKVFEEIN